MKRKVLIAAGGSGGHLLPAQELAQLLQQRHGCEVLFAGYKLSVTPFFQRDQFSYREIRSGSLGEGRGRLIKNLACGLWAAVRLIQREKPNVVVGFGSYHTAPVLLAAVLLRKKIVLFEPNRAMGKVNRWVAPFSRAVAVQFPGVAHVGDNGVRVPLFPWLRKPHSALSSVQARHNFGLDPHLLTILVFGGSQGASFLNEVVPEALATKNDVQVIHLTGSEAGAHAVQERYRRAQIRAVVKSFERNMEWAYAAADLAVCRSGAGTIAELIQFEVPAFLVPYPHESEGHQTHNARYLAERGGARWAPQDQVTSAGLCEAIESLDIREMRRALKQIHAEQKGAVEFDALVSRWGGWG